MKKKSLIFSFMREQSLFLTMQMALFGFLAILCLGITISIGTAVVRWNHQWDLMASVQVMPNGDSRAAEKIIGTAPLSDSEVRRLLPAAMKDYTPKVWELKFKNRAERDAFAERIAGVAGAKFISHAHATASAAHAGWQIVLIAAIVLILVLLALGASISAATKNIALIHRRELEILNQIGATDSFVARQLQKIIGKIAAGAAAIGLTAAAMVLLFINTMARGSIGLMQFMGLGATGWVALAAMAIAIIVFAIAIVRKTTYKILQCS